MMKLYEILSAPGYPPGNKSISPTKRHFGVDDFPSPKVGYVSFLEGIFYYCHIMLNYLPLLDPNHPQGVNGASLVLTVSNN